MDSHTVSVISAHAHLYPLRTVTFGCLLLWLSATPSAVAWGPVGHAVIAELAENTLLRQDASLRHLLANFRDPSTRRRVRKALRSQGLPPPGQILRFFANWPDYHKGKRGMLSYDRRRHYVNLPFRARYNRARHCPKGRCSIETLLQQRALLANRRAPLAKRAVALAWVTHLVGDIHQPLHAGKRDDRGGNLTCISWMDQASRLTMVGDQTQCSGANLHAVWDSKIISAVTGFTHADDAPAFARRLQPFLRPVSRQEPPLTARTQTAWRAIVEQWHTETHTLILHNHIYPRDPRIGQRYARNHYPTIRLQLLRAAVRLAALLRQTLPD